MECEVSLAVWLCLCLCLAWSHGAQHCVEILDAGLMPVIKDHIGIQFFVTVNNRGPDRTEVNVRMVQCCEDLPGSLTDCSYFHLIPETRVMDPNTTRNFTLIHPTLYPYDRRGECLLGVHYTTSCNRSKETHQHIAFDTSLTEQNARCGNIYGYSLDDLPVCRSYDEDILENCKMVDCHKKYFGLKSYFNKAARLCEPIPACMSPKKRAMPDIIYDVSTNQCRDVSGSLSDDDIQHLSHADLEPECSPYHSNQMAYLNCHNGYVDNVTGECSCDTGFMATTPPEEPGNPRTQVFHSCNVKTNCWDCERLLAYPDRTILITSFILAVILALIVIVIAQA